MAHRIGDRILETTTSTSTGNITVAGAVSGYATLDSICTTNGDTIDAVIAGGTQWEYTRLTRVSAGVYSRATPYSSSTGSAINFSAGTKEVWGDVGAFFLEHLNTVEISVASAGTCDIGAVKGLNVEITGTTTITSFGTAANKVRFGRFSGALTLTHNATSLILPGATNITTAAGDTFIAKSNASGNWRVVNYTKADGTPLVGGGGGEIARRANVLTPHENLVVKYVSATSVDIDADAVLLFDNSGVSKRFASLNETLAITSSGANGLDTGSEASSTWYHIWAIGKSDGTLDGLLSASATSPTLPVGYTYRGYLGAVYNNSSSDFRKFSQLGNRVYTDWQTTGLALNNGTATNYTAVDLTAFVPPTATAVVAQPGLGISSGTNVYCTIFLSSDGSTTTPATDAMFFSQTVPASGNKEFSPGAIVPMTTPQSVDYYASGTNVQAAFYVIGWLY